MNHEAQARQGEFVQAFERGIAVIRSFSNRPLTLSDVAHSTGMSPAAARRYLSTLVSMGYLSQEGNRFRPQVGLVELSAPYFASHSGMREAQQAAESLAREVDETATITQLDGTEVVNAFAVETMHELAIGVQLGRRLPAYCTAMGRAMLSMLDDASVSDVLDRSELVAHTELTLTDRDTLLDEIGQCRNQGFAYVREEFQAGIQTASVGFRLANGTIAAISAPTPVAREDKNSYLQRIVEPVRRAAIRAAGSSFPRHGNSG